MTEGKYDPYRGISRIAAAAKNLNKEAVEVVTLHLALEREIEKALSTALTRTDNLGRLRFGNKAAVLHSVWPGSAVDADRLYDTLDCFNELRNAFAHGDLKKIEACRRNLFVAYRSIDPDDHQPTYMGIAQGVCALMGGGMMPSEFARVAETVSRVVNEIFPAAMGEKPGRDEP